MGNRIPAADSSVCRAELCESAALATWYDAHAQVRHLWAVRDSTGLRIIVTLEPTADGDDIYPIWIANRQAWARELRQCVGQSVRLEHTDAPAFGGIEADGESRVLAVVSWRDPFAI
jgi:hypothetical protein